MAIVVNQENRKMLQFMQSDENFVDPRHSGLNIIVKQLTPVASSSHRPTSSLAMERAVKECPLSPLILFSSSSSQMNAHYYEITTLILCQ